MPQNWDDIRFFLALSRAQSFVAAANLLNVTHSTVSRRISALEATLKTQLFLRTEKGCKLTSAGEKLLPYAEALETTMLGLSEQVSGQNKRLAGTVRIGTPDGLGNCFLAQYLSTFQQQQPHLEIELIAVPMYYSLAKREVDILVTVRKPQNQNVITRKISDYKLGLFATPEYLDRHPPIATKEDLPNQRFVSYIDDLLYDETLRFLDEYVPNQKVHFRSSTVYGQMNAVVAGAGIGVIPYFMAHGNRSLVPVLPQHFCRRAFWLQVNQDSRQLARVRSTIDFIVQAIEANNAKFLELPQWGT